MATFDFADLADIERIAGDRLDEVVRGTLLDLSARVIRATPVGDPSNWQSPAPPGYVGGTARGNWQATIGQPAQGVLNRKDKDGGSTISQAMAAINSAPGNIYYLTNNVPYISRLEFSSWSDQAPAGMVRINLTRLAADIKAQIAELPK